MTAPSTIGDHVGALVRAVDEADDANRHASEALMALGDALREAGMLDEALAVVHGGDGR